MTSTPTPPLRSRWMTVRGVLLSLLFWVSLLTSAGMYAGVALAPKAVTWRSLHLQFREQQTRLLELERHTEQLQQVVSALDDDPQFAAELARLEFDAARPGEEVFAVDPAFVLNPLEQRTLATAPVTTSADPWLPYWQRLASDVDLRHRLLLAAAVLVVISFTLFHDTSESPAVAPSSTPSWRTHLWGRYASTPPTSEPMD
jgi:cell division protein FtsB